MIQDILTGVSVLSAFAYVAYSFGKIIYNSFISKESVGCAGGCSSCSAKSELLQQIKHPNNFKSSNWKMFKS